MSTGFESGRSIAVVTGANAGIGQSTTELLAGAGWSVVMVSRDRERGEKALAAVQRLAGADRVQLEIADMSSGESVRALAARLADRLDRLDALVNNAGVYRARRERTADGLEVTMATNHMGHFRLTLELLDLLRAGEGRVVNVSSDGHRRGDLRRAPLERILKGEERYRSFQAYCDSKLANVLFTHELVRRHGGDGIISNALHPGTLSTRIWNQNHNPASLMMRVFKPFMAKPDVGGRAVFRLAADPDLAEVTGRYFNVEQETRAAPQAYDEDLAAELWELSTGYLGLAA
jgi:NAD(P)-dependent dehydrogenase (short-subunit alcohol dehydrogenase family)